MALKVISSNWVNRAVSDQGDKAKRKKARKLSDKEIVDFLSQNYYFFKIVPNDEKELVATWAKYLSEENLTGRPTQLQASGSDFRKLMESAIQRENIARTSL